ncbi:MAG TPA: DUF1801 domain-containing protein [Chitinophagales bacterium]|nr:DUF1801 domain-containing protein [Chitinophagales bacterium]
MPKKDSRFDAYILKSADFAKPILTHLRKIVHKACPEVEETIKWGMPYFMYKGILCGMASFKNHCAFVFPKGSVMKDPNRILDVKRERAMGQFGRISSLKDLPSEKILIAYIKEAMKLNDGNVKLPERQRTEKKELVVPDDLMKALKKNKKALTTFESFNYSNKKDYAEWITEAKNEETRNK